MTKYNIGCKNPQCLGLSKKLDKNQLCKSCNMDKGLKQCPRCKELLLYNLNFNDPSLACKKCLGFKGKGGGRWPKMPEQTKEKIARFINQGGSGIKAAEIFNCTPAMISKVIKQYGVKNSMKAFRSYLLDETYFEKIDSEEKAYLLGFIATDGCVCDNTLIIVQQTLDAHILIDFQKNLKTNTPIKERVNNGYSKNKISRLEIFSKKITEDLAKLGVLPNKTFTIKPWEGPGHLMRHYWRGCIDGDGSLSISNNRKTTLQFAGNLDMVSGFKKWIDLNIKTNNKINTVKTIFNYSINGKNSLLASEALYKDSKIHLNRKYNKYLELVNLYRQPDGPQNQEQQNKHAS